MILLVGGMDSVKQSLLKQLEKCGDDIPCLSFVIEDAVRYKVLDDELKSRFLQALSEVVKTKGTSLVTTYSVFAESLVKVADASGDTEFASNVKKMIEPLAIRVLERCKSDACVSGATTVLSVLGIIDKIADKVLDAVNRMLKNARSFHEIETALYVAEHIENAEVRRRIEEAAEQRFAELIASKIPKWADAGLVTTLDHLYKLYPLKKSKHGSGYYYSPKWKKIAWVDIAFSGLPEYFIVEKSGRMLPAKVKKGVKYVIVIPKSGKSAEEEESMDVSN